MTEDMKKASHLDVMTRLYYKCAIALLFTILIEHHLEDANGSIGDGGTWAEHTHHSGIIKEFIVL